MATTATATADADLINFIHALARSANRQLRSKWALTPRTIDLSWHCCTTDGDASYCTWCYNGVV